jgi:hypothetical protein
MCLKCQKMRPLAQFGLRRMADGAIRNQPWCRTCRSSGAEPRRRKGSAEIAESLLSAASAETPAPAEPRARGSLASEIAAALSAGQRR